MLWTHEHGPRGGDEINIPQAGKNYGWPLATHGINYSMLPIPEAQGKTVKGTEPPHHVWDKSPGISGMAFYDAERFGLAAQPVHRRPGRPVADPAAAGWR